MPAAAARAALRPSRLVLRHAPARHASTTETVSNQAQKAKEVASKATAKTSEGLSKATASASSVASKASSAATDAAGKASEKTGGLISRVQAMIPSVVYYGKVTGELAKLVFQGQKMQPPKLSEFQSYLQPAINGIRNPSSLVSRNPGVLSPQQYLSSIRNTNRTQIFTLCLIAAEVLGFFKVGEMLGRLKIVGYRSPEGAHEEHH